MADIRTKDLPSTIDALTDQDYIAADQASSGETKKFTVAAIANGLRTATSLLKGLMSANDKAYLDKLSTTHDADGKVKTEGIQDAAVTKKKISSTALGVGLKKNDVDETLEVVVDSSSVEIVNNTIRVKDTGITKAKLNADVATDGLEKQTSGAIGIKTDAVHMNKLHGAPVLFQALRNQGLSTAEAKKTETLKFGPIPTSRQTTAYWHRRNLVTYCQILTPKIIERIGIFIASNAAIIGNLRIKVFLNGSLIKDTVILNSEIAGKYPYTTAAAAEYKFDLDYPLSLSANDILCVGFQSTEDDKFSLMNTAMAPDPLTEFGINRYIFNDDINYVANLASAPALPAQDTQNFVPFRAYEYKYENIKISQSELAITQLQAQIPPASLIDSLKKQSLSAAEYIATELLKMKGYNTASDYGYGALSATGTWTRKCFITYTTIRSAKVIDKIGIFIALNAENPSDMTQFSGSLLVKIWKNDGLIKQVTIDNATLNTKVPYKGLQNAEHKISLDAPLGLSVGDRLVVGFQHSGAEKLSLVYQNAVLDNTQDFGELKQYLTDTDGYLAGITSPPPGNYTASTPFYIPFHGYEVKYENKKLTDLSTSLATKADKTKLSEVAMVLSKQGMQAYTLEDRIKPPAPSIWSANMVYITKLQKVWYKGISSKIFDQIGVYIVRDLYNNLQFTDSIIIKVFLRNELIKTHEVTLLELAPYNLLIKTSPISSFEYKFNLDYPVELNAGDIVFIGMECKAATDKMGMIYSMNESTINDSAEWTRNYKVQDNTANAIINLTAQPALPASSNHYIGVNFYFKRYAQSSSLADLSLLTPKKVYTVLNDLAVFSPNMRQRSIPLFLDHFIKGITSEKDIRFKETKTDKVLLYSPVNNDDGLALNHGNVQTYSKTFNILGGSTYNNAAVTVEQKSVKESVGKTLFPKILVIGDSVTDGFLSDMNVPAGGPNKYWAVIRDEFERAKIDGGDVAGEHKCLMIGKKSISSWLLTYGNVVNRALKAFAEGYGGWSLSTHLYWSYNWATKAQGLWDALGLGDGTGTDYIGSDAQKLLLFTTPEGKNAPKDTAAFRTWINAELTGNAATYAEAVALLNAKEANPDNPFYDKATAQATDHAFSLKAYLNRYKTLANDGTTRLQAGSTAGSKVTDVNAYDVCLPTHIIIQHSHNDGNVSWQGSNYRKLTNAIKAEYTSEGWGSVFIGISIIDHTGTYFPSLYTDFDNYSVALWNHEAGHAKGYDNQQRVFTEFWVNSANEDAEKIYILPSYHIQPTAWATPYRHLPSPEYDVTGQLQHSYKKMYGAGPDWHPNGISHKVWGLEMYAWIKYTLSL